MGGIQERWGRWETQKKSIRLWKVAPQDALPDMALLFSLDVFLYKKIGSTGSRRIGNNIISVGLAERIQDKSRRGE